MDESAKVLLGIAGGAVGGAVIAGLFGVVGAWIASRREHSKWLREEKLRAYTDFLLAVEEFLWTLGETRVKAETRLDIENFAEEARKIEQARILLLAPSRVYYRANKTIEAITALAEVISEDPDLEDEVTFLKASDQVRTARDNFSAELRKDLGVPQLAKIL